LHDHKTILLKYHLTKIKLLTYDLKVLYVGDALATLVVIRLLHTKCDSARDDRNGMMFRVPYIQICVRGSDQGYEMLLPGLRR
jgi:hypothetical protein